MEIPVRGSVAEPSRWTQPLQAAVAAFFVVSAVVNVAIILAFGDLYRHRFTQVYQASGQVAPDQVGSSADAAMTLTVAITVGIAVLYLVLAGITYFRRARWVFVIDLIVLFLAGAPVLAGGTLNALLPSRAGVPQVFGLTQLVLAVAALSLCVLMLGLWLRYGAWAQRRPLAAVAD